MNIRVTVTASGPTTWGAPTKILTRFRKSIFLLRKKSLKVNLSVQILKSGPFHVTNFFKVDPFN